MESPGDSGYSSLEELSDTPPIRKVNLLPSVDGPASVTGAEDEPRQTATGDYAEEQQPMLVPRNARNNEETEPHTPKAKRPSLFSAFLAAVMRTDAFEQSGGSAPLCEVPTDSCLCEILAPRRSIDIVQANKSILCLCRRG